MDADQLLRQIRVDLAAYGDLLDKPVAEIDPDLVFARHVRDLDSYLSQGGTPPADWAGGPDVPDEHIYVPAFDRPPVEPLGGPVPGANGSHLPEHPEQGCVRCGNPITWDGEAWVHVRDGVVRHPARAGLWPGAAIANDEPGR